MIHNETSSTMHKNAQHSAQHIPTQPWLHDREVIVSAPAQLWSNGDGLIDGEGVSGFYVGDTRMISAVSVVVNGVEPQMVRHSVQQSNSSSNVYLARNITGSTVDPMFRIDECREIGDGLLTLEYRLRNGLHRSTHLVFELHICIDNTDMQSIKGGVDRMSETSQALHIAVGDSACDVNSDAGALRISASPDAEVRGEGLECSFIWDIDIPPSSQTTLQCSAHARSPRRVVVPARGKASWHDALISTRDSRLDAWVSRSLQDLEALRMSIPDLPDDEFLAAGAPWFFTLFGRDSLWAARFMLPITNIPALGTLRTLAHFQAEASDSSTNAEPGKIPHELRAQAMEYAGAFAGHHLDLPPLYYGTVDATALWVILFAELVDSHIAKSEVEALVPHMERALEWIRDFGDADGDGFLEYVDTSGHGLANQGWKDSGDSVRWRDGSIAKGPIALCEVQGYAYQAAMDGARMLDAFGRKGGDQWRSWASKLKERFNAQFWISDESGRYPAIALDGDKRPVDSLTSNIGHLLGTGIIDGDGVDAIASRLMSPELNSGYGIRTLSSHSGGYWPLSYHCGSVWAHDTAIAMLGLYQEGRAKQARIIGEELIKAAEQFDYQMPELYSGDAAPNLVPYPAACHPQAWSAASSIAVYKVFQDNQS